MSAVTRVLAFFSKWMAEIVRQPMLMLTMVIGPFLVLLAFGNGIDIGGPRPRTIIVRPPAAEGQEIQPLPEELDGHITVVGETDNLDSAREALRQGDADAVAVLPEDPLGTIESGQRVPIQILLNEIDPVTKSYAQAYLGDQVNSLNRQTIAKAITEAQKSVDDVSALIQQARPLVNALAASDVDLASARTQLQDIRELIDPIAQAVDAADRAITGTAFVVPGLGRLQDRTNELQTLVRNLDEDVSRLERQLGEAESNATLPTDADIDELNSDLNDIDVAISDLQRIPPEVLAAPFELKLENIAPFVPDFAGYYAPAVLVLLLQHLGITLAALSMSRIRLLGLIDFMRVSPVRPTEVVLGNYLSYGSVCCVAGAALVGLSVTALDVPVFGPWLYVAAGLGLVVAAALGAGFVVAMLSRSEQQAAQVAMLILLTAIFFSGFVFTLDRIAWPVRAISYVLPSTYGIRVLQDVMLRGVLQEPTDLLVLAGMTLVLFAATVILFKREFRPR